jgi:hypothetical protein
MNPSSTNPVYNNPDIRNESANSSINDPDIRRMHPDVSDHLDSETKLWPNVGQVGQHYEFWPAL